MYLGIDYSNAESFSMFLYHLQDKAQTPYHGPQCDSLMSLPLTLSVWDSITESQTLATDPALLTGLHCLPCFTVEPHPTANGPHHSVFAHTAPFIRAPCLLLHLTSSTLSLEHLSALISSTHPPCIVPGHGPWGMTGLVPRQFSLASMSVWVSSEPEQGSAHLSAWRSAWWSDT